MPPASPVVAAVRRAWRTADSCCSVGGERFFGHLDVLNGILSPLELLEEIGEVCIAFADTGGEVFLPFPPVFSLVREPVDANEVLHVQASIGEMTVAVVAGKHLHHFHHLQLLLSGGVTTGAVAAIV